MTKPEKVKTAQTAAEASGADGRSAFDCRSVSWNVRRLAAVRRCLERSPLPAGLCASPPRGARAPVARKAPAAEIRLPAAPPAVSAPAAPPACHLQGRPVVPLQRHGLQPVWLYDRER